MIKLIKELIRAMIENPREGLILVKMFLGIFISAIIGLIWYAPQILLDKIKPDMIKFRHEKNRDYRYTKT